MIAIRQTQTILDQIVESKQRRLSILRQTLPVEKLAEQFLSAADAGSLPRAGDFAAALRQPEGLAMIAEIKKASPSRGLIQADFRPAEQAMAYAGAGVQAISVLTEEDYFAGSDQDLAAVRQVVGLPILRKDFIIEPGQIYEARLMGASAILLICALLDEDELIAHLRLADLLGLSALVEVHDLPQLMQALSAGASIIGINNRDLRTFHIELATTERLAGLIPNDRTIVAESGVLTSRDLARVYRAGAHAVLVGEALMRSAGSSESVRQKIRELTRELPR